jgi:hypothetical protein
MIVTAPADRQVVSNGVLVEEQDLANGRRRTHWKQSVPIATWLFAVGIARFDVHYAGEVNGIPLQTWVFPEDRDAGRAVFEETSRRAGILHDRIGPYPFAKLANVQHRLQRRHGGGDDDFLRREGVARAGRRWSTIAHQWLATPSPSATGTMCGEWGFTTYFALLYTNYDGRGRSSPACNAAAPWCSISNASCPTRRSSIATSATWRR